MKIDELKKRIANFENVDLIGTVSDDLIRQAEAELGFKLPSQYRAFISNFGCGGIESEEFIGLGGPEHLNVSKMVVRLKGKNRALPHHLLPLRADGFGNYDCVDLQQPRDGAEFAIVRWVHDATVEDQHEVVADSYWQWFESILTMIESSE
ncbi:SMI1/KNR4 family protein [Prosthecobacter fluviatilis]|uniref:SMI1/KNR4 family protein n=1 Tax=Prosthecobacter fluviatilis TaxID=445931 RepID=A0ABW0KWE3_9BACT